MEQLIPATPHDLVGAMFTTPKDLRHLAEQQFGQLFVPVEVLAKSAHRATIELRLDSLGPVVVHAERARHWYPYRIVRVDTDGARNVAPRIVP